jgi:hypothetical protein
MDLYHMYAMGYWQGRRDGSMDIPETLPEEARLLWKQGYDRGVTDYCDHDMDEGA